jgi:hypothetical protein
MVLTEVAYAFQDLSQHKIFQFTLKGHNVLPIFRSQVQYIGMLDVRELSGTEVGWSQFVLCQYKIL